MITPGQYSVWFKTPIGEGAGVVTFHPDGNLEGGDFTFVYTGVWKIEKDRFRAELAAKREHPGPPGVFGLDAVDLIVHPDTTESEKLVGFAKQAPGLKLEVTLTAIAD